MSVTEINTANGSRWVVRRKIAGKQVKRWCLSLAAAEALDAEWAAEAKQAIPPRKRMTPQSAFDLFLRSRWV